LYPLDRKLGGPQSRSERGGEDVNLCAPVHRRIFLLLKFCGAFPSSSPSLNWAAFRTVPQHVPFRPCDLPPAFIFPPPFQQRWSAVCSDDTGTRLEYCNIIEVRNNVPASGQLQGLLDPTLPVQFCLHTTNCSTTSVKVVVALLAQIIKLDVQAR